MSTLLDNNKALLIMQFVLAIVLFAAWVYIYVTTGNSQTDLFGLVALVVGFFFGAETVDRVNKARR